MTQHDRFLSRNASTMRESAIRQMGAVLARTKDMILDIPTLIETCSGRFTLSPSGW